VPPPSAKDVPTAGTGEKHSMRSTARLDSAPKSRQHKAWRRKPQGRDTPQTPKSPEGAKAGRVASRLLHEVTERQPPL
jgi:hypothetical protein